MKLNLLPKIVDTTSKAKKAFVFSLLALVGSILAAVWMISTSQSRLDAAQKRLDEIKPDYDAVVKIAADADSMISSGKVKQVALNAELAASMKSYNDRYVELYNSVFPYIPRFFRIVSINATPIDDKTCTVTMSGTVRNAQEYADLMLALLRIKGATSVGRAGFQNEDIIVPPLTEIDQVGRPRKESEAPIPDDAVARLDYFQNQQVPSGFMNSGNFGVTEAGTEKTVRPRESLITVSVVIPKDIRTPNPRGTIQSLQGSATPVAGGGPVGGGPVGGGPVGGPANIPTGAPTGAPTGGPQGGPGDDR
jgi:hypothetical protein